MNTLESSNERNQLKQLILRASKCEQFDSCLVARQALFNCIFFGGGAASTLKKLKNRNELGDEN